MGTSGELLLVIDLAARNVVGHCYTKDHINTKMVCETITEIAHNRKFLPKINIIHSDKGAIFTNEEFLQCLDSLHIKALHIKASQAHSLANQNQPYILRATVSERLNRTIKTILRKKINSNWSKSEKDPLTFNSLSVNEFEKVVHESIEFYNNREHKALFGLTPNQMEEALFKAHGNQHPTDVQLLTHNIESNETNDIIQYKQTVVNKYKGNWEQFFIDWRLEQQKWILQQQQNHQQLLDNHQQLLDELEKNKEKYDSLYHQYIEIQQQLKVVHEKTLNDIKEQELKKQLKEKKKKC